MDIKIISKYFLSVTKRYKFTGVMIFVAYSLALTGSALVSPLIYKRIVDIVSTGSPETAGQELTSILLFLGLIILIYNIFYRIGDYLMVFFQSKIMKDLADDALARLEKHSYEFFTSSFTGSLIAKVKRYVQAFETIHDQIVFTLWFNGFRLTFGFAALTYFSPILGSIFLVWLIIYGIVVILFTKKKFKKDILTAKANSETTGVLSDIITNILNVKIFSSQKEELKYFATTTNKEEILRRDAWNFRNLQFTFQGFFIGAFEFIGMATALYLWKSGDISIGTIILMQTYIFIAFDAVWNMSRNFTHGMQAAAEAKEMIDIFEKPLQIKNHLSPEKCVIQKGEVTIKDVSFNYQKTRIIFKDLSLKISSGEKIGLVGPSGAGKSSIVKLILRFADPDKGEILIDGQNIAKITQNDLRSKIAFVAQDSVLFHRTLRENIAYSKPEATMEEIINAAKMAHAHEFIDEFPEKYNTYVGERGVKLSGGERQRVSIARAMLKNAPILILDEATSSLDSLSEKYIQEAFEELSKNRTTIVIAHRLSTIRKMDKIIVLNKGVIMEEGNHQELVAKKGFYYKLWKQQTMGFIGS